MTPPPDWRVVNLEPSYVGNADNLADLDAHPAYRLVQGGIGNGEHVRAAALLSTKPLGIEAAFDRVHEGWQFRTAT